jgi:hypothetical protein
VFFGISNQLGVLRANFFEPLGSRGEAMGAPLLSPCSQTLYPTGALRDILDWAQYRRTKGAVKLHLLLDHQGLLPSFALITEGRVHESRVARSLRFEPGTIVVFDRGYADYDWFAALDAQGVFFVTRLKDNADYGVLERRPVPSGSAVRRDQIIFLYKATRGGHLDLFLRRIEVWDEEQSACPGVSHQSSRLRRFHHRRHLPPALADRAVL